MSNPWKDYLQNFRDNLPAGVTYREDIARYVFNDKRFILPNDVVRYKNYLEKLGFISSVITAIIQPALGPLEDGDTIASGMSADYDQTSNYASSEGTISSVDAAVTVNGSPALFTDTVDFEDVVAVTVTVTDSEANERVFNAGVRTVSALVPDAFTAPDWDVAHDGETVSVNILTLPADGGSAITDLEYRVNAGAAISLGETTTGSYPITADDGDDIQVRAVNAVGAGDWSDVKAVPAGETGDLPDLAYDVLLEAYDPDSLFADTEGTTAAAVDGAVARVNDTSVNSNHATQGTTAARPLRRQSGDLNWLDFDGVDDRLVIAPDASWVKDGMSLVSVFRVPLSVDRLVLLGNAGTGENAIIGYMRDETFKASLNVGTPDYYTNGAFTGADINRIEAYAAWVTGGWVIAEVAHVDLVGSSIASEGAQFPGWRQRTTELGPVDFGAQILIPTATLDTGTNRADLVAALADKFGITL